MGDKTHCSNYRGISLLSTTYKILTNIHVSRSSTDHTYCICQILEKIWEYNKEVHQPFIDYKKAYDSVRREVLYNILNQFGIPMEKIRLIKMCWNETHSWVRIGKHLSDMFPIRNGLKYWDGLLPLLFNFDLEQAIRRVQVDQEDFI